MMALRQNPSCVILAHKWSWPAPGDTGAHFATVAQDAAMNAPHIQVLTVEAGEHDEAVGGLCAEKLAPEFAVQKATIVCHKMTNVMSRLRHIILFEETDLSPAGAGSDQAVVSVDRLTIISCVMLDLATLSVAGILLHCIRRRFRTAGL